MSSDTGCHPVLRTTVIFYTEQQPAKSIHVAMMQSEHAPKAERGDAINVSGLTYTYPGAAEPAVWDVSFNA